MMSELIVAGFAMACGFVAAGLLSSLYQCITSRPAGFELTQDRVVAGVAQILLLMFAGPVILMRAALRAFVVDRRPLSWLAGATLAAAAWSLCSGVVVLEFALALRSTIV
jgi:hypothetical protein